MVSMFPVIFLKFIWLAVSRFLALARAPQYIKLQLSCSHGPEGDVIFSEGGRTSVPYRILESDPRHHSSILDRNFGRPTLVRRKGTTDAAAWAATGRTKSIGQS